MVEDADLNAIAAEVGTSTKGDCGCGCGGNEPVSLVATDTGDTLTADLEALERDLQLIEGAELDSGDELSLALAGEGLSLEDELEFAAAVDGEQEVVVGLEELLDLLRVNPGLKVTLGF